MKKRNKGFTLIELIVVIAILAILAMIAIPRFAGFTDRAKIQSDEQYAALVGNSAVVLLAANDIKITDETKVAYIGIDKDGVLTFDNLAVVSTDATVTLTKLMTTLVQPTKLQYYDGATDKIYVKVTKEGNHVYTGVTVPTL